MTPKSDVPIPVPFAKRWCEVRMRWLPLVVFLGTLGTIALLWRDHVAAPSLMGQAEPVLATVSSYKPGVLTELHVTRFQKVKAGDTLGRVLVAEPRVLESSLAVIRAEIDLLRANQDPIVAQQQNAIDYTQLQLDWMKERAALASVQVSLQLARTELCRTQELFKVKIASAQELDLATATCRGWEEQVDQLNRLVADVSRNMSNLQLTNCPTLTTVSAKPLEAAIAVQEALLRQVEADLSPVVLVAPIDGMVSNVLRHAGDSVVAGEPLIGISSLSPARIVGYMRQPLVQEPKVGMHVEVRMRNARREVGQALVQQVGTQFEPLPDSLVGPVKLACVELALPLEITLPPNLALRSGELVDIAFSTKAD